jgi:hypothetical protein
MPKEGDRKDCFLSAFEESPCVCPVGWLFRYLKATSNRIRMSESEASLFVSSWAPHNSAAEDTIGSWVSQTLESCGITTQTHGTRAVSSSFAADAKVPLEAVPSLANWASLNTFFAHYSCASFSGTKRKSPTGCNAVAEAILRFAKCPRTT